MNRPEPLLSLSDYLEDFKARVEIHNYEVKKLQKDIRFGFDFVSDRIYFNLVNK